MIYDYLMETQPDVLKLLKQLFNICKPRLHKINQVKISLWCDEDDFEFYKAMMETPYYK